MERNLPKLVAFDLDYTLWPFWIEIHVTPPFHKNKHGEIVDCMNEVIKTYADSSSILEWLKLKGILLAAASRTSEIEGAHALLDLLGWKKYLDFVEIFPGSKITHFNNIQKKSGIKFSDMLFFDDDSSNIEDVKTLGVWCCLVRNGISHAEVQKGLASYSKFKIGTK